MNTAAAECIAVWFSTQHRATMVQANLREGDSDVEMKRMRESEDDSEVKMFLPAIAPLCVIVVPITQSTSIPQAQAGYSPVG